jgi:hypothetical protein
MEIPSIEPVERARSLESELEGPGRDEMIREEEAISNGEVGRAEIQEIQEIEIEDEHRMAGLVLEFGWQHEVEQEGEEEDDESDNLAEAIKSWPVLSKHQSTRFKYRILTKGMSICTQHILQVGEAN